VNQEFGLSQETNAALWRYDLDEKPQALKVAPGEFATFTFLSEGETWTHPRFKPAVRFEVRPDGEEGSAWLYVRSKALLRQIRALGPALKGIKVDLYREGSGLETRYRLTKVSEE